MELLILALLGLTTVGVTKAFSPDEEEDSKDAKDSKDSKGKGKGGKDSKNGKDSEEPKKTPRQKLMEAIAEYEAEVHEGEKVKIHLEIEDR